MKNFWKKYKASVIIISYIIIVASLIYFIFLPYFNKIKEKSNSIQAKMLDNQIRQSALNQLPAMEKDYADYQANSNDLNVILGQSDEVTFIKTIESLAGQTSNKITMSIPDTTSSSASGGNSSSGGKAPKSIKDQLAYNNYIQMEIDLVGNYPALVNFLNKLENENYYVNILSFNLKEDVSSLDDSSPAPNSNIFSPSNATEKSVASNATKEVIDSTLEVVIYLKK